MTADSAAAAAVDIGTAAGIAVAAEEDIGS